MSFFISSDPIQVNNERNTIAIASSLLTNKLDSVLIKIIFASPIVFWIKKTGNVIFDSNETLLKFSLVKDLSDSNEEVLFEKFVSLSSSDELFEIPNSRVLERTEYVTNISFPLYFKFSLLIRSIGEGTIQFGVSGSPDNTSNGISYVTFSL
jgi:hypothetical protein